MTTSAGDAASTAATTTTTGTDTAAKPAETASGATETAAAKVEPSATETPEQKIERLEAAVKAANAEAAKTRTTAKANAADEARKELAQQVGKALGLVEDDTVDPAKLAGQVSSLTAETKQAKVELAVFHGAAAAGGDAMALLDSRAFMAKLADVDPADTAAITAAITEAVKANPALAKPEALVKPGGKPVAKLRPGAAPAAGERAATLEDAIAARYSQT